jgi:hypothetical protein
MDSQFSGLEFSFPGNGDCGRQRRVRLSEPVTARRGGQEVREGAQGEVRPIGNWPRTSDESYRAAWSGRDAGAHRAVVERRRHHD